MMFFLVVYISNNLVDLRSGIRKGPESFLPLKLSGHETFLIDDAARIGLYFLNEFRYLEIGFEADENMNVIRNSPDGNELLTVIRHNSCDVFVKLLPPFGRDQIFAALNGEHHVDVNLGECICHGSYAVPTELKFIAAFMLQTCRSYGAKAAALLSRFVFDRPNGFNRFEVISHLASNDIFEIISHLASNDIFEFSFHLASNDISANRLSSVGAACL